MATTKKSPVETVKDKFQEKENLVDRVLGVIFLEGEDKDAAKKKLLAVSNKKLLRMLEVSGEIKSKYGSPQGLAEAAAKALGKAKDQSYVAKLAAAAKKTPAKVWDLLQAAEKRAKAQARA